jgi:NMD protein affecting ribosome stability and mRNA decay
VQQTYEPRLCPRCARLAGRDVGAIIRELEIARAPGQEYILRCLKLLDERLGQLEQEVDNK